MSCLLHQSIKIDMNCIWVVYYNIKFTIFYATINARSVHYKRVKQTINYPLSFMCLKNGHTVIPENVSSNKVARGKQLK